MGTQGGVGRHNPDQILFNKVKIETAEFNHLNKQCLYVDDQNRAWLTYENEGLIQYDLEKKKLVRFDHLSKTFSNGNQAQSVYSYENKDLYIGTKKGFEKMDLETLSMEEFHLSPEQHQTIKDFYIQYLLVDSKQRVWIATEQGLIIYNPEDAEFQIYRHDPKNPNSISDNSVTQIIEASNGEYWISTYNGLKKSQMQI